MPARVVEEKESGVHFEILESIPSPGTGVEAGTLVEIDTPRALYLGETLSAAGPEIAVALEHSLDRAALAAIHRVWHRPAGA